MRLTPLLALAAASTISATAGAQEGRVRAPRPSFYRYDAGDQEHRAALGIGTSATGTLRDTLGLMITSITRGGPAEKAGLEEGNRIAAINGVNLRANAADIEDSELSGALTRRLTRELGKAKPGDEVELRVYRDGRTQALKVKTADSDSLFRRYESVRVARADREDRPALGFSIGSTGSRRDTLGVLVMSVADSTPAARAGLEEGNRIAAINGVNLRVAREDAGDRYLGNAKAQRLQREIAALKPGSNVTLRVYSNGQARDVTLKVARAGDLPRYRGAMILGDGMGVMPPMPPMPPMREMRFEMGPELRRELQRVRVNIDQMRPELERMRMELPRMLERVRVPNVQLDVDFDVDMNDIVIDDDHLTIRPVPAAPVTPATPATPATRATPATTETAALPATASAPTAQMLRLSMVL
jgi:S1-C subfamily serine protease